MATAARSVRLVDVSNNTLSDGSDSENEEAPSNQEVNQANVEQIYAKEKKKRKKREQLQPNQLITALASIPHEFSSKLSRGVSSEQSVKSAARYANTLMQLYADFVTDLPCQPDLAKVQKIGSSREVRDACKMQRIVVTRNPYLESVLGKEATKDLLLQLDEYEAEQRAQELDEINASNATETGNLASPQASSEESRDQTQAGTENLVASTPVAPTTNAVPPAITKAVDDDSEDEFEFDVAPSKPRLAILEDSEDEEELDDSTRKRKRIIPEDYPEPAPATDTSRGAMGVGSSGSDPPERPATDASVQLSALMADKESVVAEASSARSILEETAPAVVPGIIVHEVQKSRTDKESEPCSLDVDRAESDIPPSEETTDSGAEMLAEAPATQMDPLGQPTQDYGASSDDEVATIIPSMTMPDSP